MGEQSREIKFRMFDTLEKNFMNGSRVIESRINDLNKGGRFTYQQWTGLKDKNGKEIYEGDILHLFCDCDPGDYAYCTHPPTVHKVVWNEEEAGYDLVQISKGKVFEDFSKYMEESWEVIGNIYENPELLEVK